MIEIFTGDARDIASIMPIMNTAFDPLYDEAWTASQCISALTLPSTNLWIAKHGEDICGFAITRWVLDEEEILLIAVSPEHQNLSIGKMILKNIVTNAVNGDRNKIFLEVRDGNTAIHFYKNMGFHEIGRRRSYYRNKKGDKYDAITMQVSIKAAYCD